MSTTADEAALINGAQFLDELETWADVPEPGLASQTYGEGYQQTYDEGYDALDSGLPLSPNADPTGAPHDERPALDDPYAPLVPAPARAEQYVPSLAAALVVVVCLTVGAATAALVFHDRLTHITALQPASR